MKCKKCGNVFTGNYCNKCGAKAEIEPTPVNPYQFKNENAQPIPAPVQTNRYYNINTPQNKSQYKRTSKGVIALFLILASVFLVMIIALPFGIIMLADKTSEHREETYSINEKAVMGAFEYSLEDVSTAESFRNDKPESGYEFLKIKLKMKNISDTRESNYSEIELYVDDGLYDEYSDNYYLNDIDGGKFRISEFVYEIPKNRNNTELVIHDEEDFGLGKIIKFNISDND